MAEHSNFKEASVEIENPEDVPVGKADVESPSPTAGPSFGNQPVDPEVGIDASDLGDCRIQVGMDQGRKIVILNLGPVGIKTLGMSFEQARHFGQVLISNADSLDKRLAAIAGDTPGADGHDDGPSNVGADTSAVGENPSDPTY